MSQIYYRSFVKDNLVVISGHILVYLKGIIIMPLIIKSVGLTTYGGFALLTSILGIVFGLSSLGAGFRAKRYLPSANTMSERGDLFYPQLSFNVLTTLALSLLLVLLKEPLNTWLFKNEVTFSIWIVPLYLISYLFFAQGSDYFRYTSRVHLTTLAGLCFPYLHIGFILFYIYFYGPISIDALIISMAVSALIIALPFFWVVLRELRVRVSFYGARSLISDLKLGFPLTLGFIVDFILAASDRYFIALYLSVTAVGYYVPGYVLGSLIVFIPKAMGTALPQLISRAMDNGNESEARIMLRYAIKIFLLLSIPFIFGCMALSKPLLDLIANQEVAEKSSLVTPIVALGTLFYGLTLLLSNVLFVRLKTNAIFQMNLIAALFSLLANMLLLYFFRDVIVAAVTTFLSYLIAFLYSYRIVVREWKIDFNVIEIAKMVIASLTMYLQITIMLSYMGRAGHLVICFLSILTGTLTYILVLLVLKILTTSELQFIRRTLIMNRQTRSAAGSK